MNDNGGSPSSLGFDDLDQDPAAREHLAADLARANLLRMRGDYKGAVDQCLSILKRAPEDGDAHTLVGDIYAEQGDLEQAAQWYELALDLNPKSSGDRTKLEQVRQRMRERETATAAEQLGLPPDRPNPLLLGGVALVILLALGIGSYLLGQRAEIARHSSVARTIPVNAPPQGEAASPDADAGGQSAAPGTAPLTAPDEDRTLTQLISQRSTDGAHLISALQDPRTKVITLTYSVGAEEDERHIGAELARTALTQEPESLLVVLRAARNDRLVYAADVPKSRVSETDADAWKQANPAADAWVNYVLTNEWSSHGATSDATIPTGTATGTAAAGATAPTSTGTGAGAAPSTAGSSGTATTGTGP